MKNNIMVFDRMLLYFDVGCETTNKNRNSINSEGRYREENITIYKCLPKRYEDENHNS
jgi:hypothetical protein